jgi:hypothetical protein
MSTIEDPAYAHRIGLLRSYYLRTAPELEPYIVAVRGTGSSAPSAWQLTLTVAGMVAVVNGVVVAACAGLVLEAVGARSLLIPAVAGAVIGAGTFWLHERHHRSVCAAYRPDAVDRAAIRRRVNADP